jgi:hypothetical protein
MMMRCIKPDDSILPSKTSLLITIAYSLFRRTGDNWKNSDTWTCEDDEGGTHEGLDAPGAAASPSCVDYLLACGFSRMCR